MNCINIDSIVKIVMTKHFSNGFRIDSIELLRFRRFAEKVLGEILSYSDQEIIEAIYSCGMYYDGKLYVISSETIEKIKREIDLTFEIGSRIIFYCTFYEIHEKWLFRSSVISKDMLRHVLQNIYPQYKFRNNYLTCNNRNESELTSIEAEIMRVWGNNVLRSFDQLAGYLPYIPLDKIKYVLSYRDIFIWNSEGVYAWIEKILVSDLEKEAIVGYVENYLNSHVYISLSAIPSEELFNNNHNLSPSAIQLSIYQKCLSHKYNRMGKIITKKGITLDALTIMKDYCESFDRCSLDDLFCYQKDFIGDNNKGISLEAGLSVLIRIDKDIFVSDQYVNFDVDSTDKLIDKYVLGDYLPLKSFTTFITFPHCGQVWNLFLLESYCRRFSKIFRFDSPSVNSSNVGVVIRKNCELYYIDIMADAVAKAELPLKSLFISKFLFENGYTGRRTTAKDFEIIEKAKVIRERVEE